jgi:hypothetical protein
MPSSSLGVTRWTLTAIVPSVHRQAGVLTWLAGLCLACGSDSEKLDDEAQGTEAATSRAVGTGEGSTSEGKDGASSSEGEPGDETGPSEDLDMSAEDFTCLLEWEKVRRFRITNLLGRMSETLEVASSPRGGSTRSEPSSSSSPTKPW